MQRFFELLVDLLAPRRCPSCDALAETWCAACGAPGAAEADAIGDVPLFAGGDYDGSLAAAIQRFKYRSRPDLARPLAQLIVARALPRLRVPGAVFVPVPLHFARLVERGFNQSALIARELSRAASARTLPRLLTRVRDTGRQAELDRREREANVKDAFRVGTSRLPKAAFIVDDVVTTGATALACVAALERAGVEVHGICALAFTGKTRSARLA
jgi:ComF family protein